MDAKLVLEQLLFRTHSKNKAKNTYISFIYMPKVSYAVLYIVRIHAMKLAVRYIRFVAFPPKITFEKRRN
jgi:hypothetical protein